MDVRPGIGMLARKDTSASTDFHHEAHTIVDARRRADHTKWDQSTRRVVSCAAYAERIDTAMRSAEAQRSVVVPRLVGVGSPNHGGKISIDTPASKAAV